MREHSPFYNVVVEVAFDVACYNQIVHRKILDDYFAAFLALVINDLDCMKNWDLQLALALELALDRIDKDEELLVILVVNTVACLREEMVLTTTKILWQ
mmetsp:Transcript_26053/g.77137  ORF Transcript_26053/g.77137 Transcript_26053/m.77137 type:complete len:99 (-) Transcript_26053:14-310(-)